MNVIYFVILTFNVPCLIVSTFISCSLSLWTVLLVGTAASNLACERFQLIPDGISLAFSLIYFSSVKKCSS